MEASLPSLSLSLGPPTRRPFSLFFGWEGSPTKIVGTLILASLLENLVNQPQCSPPKAIIPRQTPMNKLGWMNLGSTFCPLFFFSV